MCVCNRAEGMNLGPDDDPGDDSERDDDEVDVKKRTGTSKNSGNDEPQFFSFSKLASA